MLIMVIGVFLLGPERIPVAVQWVFSSLKKMRTMAQGAQAQLHSELGPEIAEMRRQIADLQGLNELQELRQLRDLHPKNLIGKGLLGGAEGQTTGGIAGFLGLDPTALNPMKPVSAGGPAEAVAAAAAAGSAVVVGTPAQPEVSMVKPDSNPITVDDPVPAAAADPLPMPAPAQAPAPAPSPVAEPVAAAAVQPSPEPPPGAAAEPSPDAAPEPAPEPVPVLARTPYDIDGT
ncbi:MAG: hypothetical protein M3Z00_11380 [Actinomycetota bacterium]|nr:hypothetical protein [Actinomycetota bacterium]